MQKTKRRANIQKDIYADLTKIKKVLAHASRGVKNRTNEVIAEQLYDVRDKTLGIQDDLVGYVTDQPVKALGFAVVTGFILGKFIL
jgi:hypothetical protein